MKESSGLMALLRECALGCFALQLGKLEQSSFQHFQAVAEKPTEVRGIKADGRVGFWRFAWKHHAGDERETSLRPHDPKMVAWM